jgi:hypothetical protein
VVSLDKTLRAGTTEKVTVEQERTGKENATGTSEEIFREIQGFWNLLLLWGTAACVLSYLAAPCLCH